MEQLIDQYLQEAGISANKQIDEDGDPMYFADMEFERRIYFLSIFISSEYQNVILMLSAPISVPPSKRRDIAEYIARANYNSCYEGNIILDYSDGSLAYKCSLRFDPAEDNSHIRYQLNIGPGMALEEMETHCPGIQSVIHKDVSPEDAHHKAIRDSAQA